MTEVALMSAVGFVLDTLAGVFLKGIFFSGGSIGIAMCAVLIIAYRRGAITAILTGLIIGVLDLMTGAYIVHPLQLFLDYVFPYALVGFAGVFKFYIDNARSKGSKIGYIIAGTALGGVLKLVSHLLSGVIFFVTTASDLWFFKQLPPFVYSLVYNGAFIFPSIILCILVMITIQLNAPKLLQGDKFVPTSAINDHDLFAHISSISFIAIGSGLFVTFLVFYIMSYEGYKEESFFEYGFNSDCMVIFVYGLLIMLRGIIALIRIKNKNHANYTMMAGFTALTFSTAIYALARLIRAINKAKDPTNYIIWLPIALVITGIGIFFWIKTYKDRNFQVPRDITSAN